MVQFTLDSSECSSDETFQIRELDEGTQSVTVREADSVPSFSVACFFASND